MNNILESDWIRVKKMPHRHDCFFAFRAEFSVDRLPLQAHLHIAADSDFIAWINGEEVARGQFVDFSEAKTYGTFDCRNHLRAGRNTVAVGVVYKGEDFHQYQTGPMGLIALVEGGGKPLCSSGDHWRGIVDPAYRQGFAERMTWQCGYTFEFDARKELGWRAPSFSDEKWADVFVVQKGALGSTWPSLTPRPLPPLVLGNLVPSRIVAQGSFQRGGQYDSAAEAMSDSFLRSEIPAKIFKLPPSHAKTYEGPPANLALRMGSKEGLPLQPPSQSVDGCYVIFDLEEETVGLLEFEITAEAGTVLEIAHGEHLDDGRVRMKIGNRNFADRYLCQAGRQKFQMPYRRFGARFLQVHVSKFSSLIFHSFSLRRVDYPTDEKSAFKSPDSMTTRIFEMAVRTLELCRHEHYEDCPWREQALYAYDARLQARYGYHAFGDYRFPEVSFSLLGRSLRPDHLIALTAPSREELVIPIFSFAWVTALAEHYLYSGDPVLIQKFETAVTQILESALSRFDPKSGLYHLPTGKEYWHFYEWTSGLCGEIGNGETGGQHHAAYNLHLYEALLAVEWMMTALGKPPMVKNQKRIIARHKKALHSAFWDESLKGYRSTRERDGELCGEHELIQALFLALGIAPPGDQKSVLKGIIAGRFVPCTLSATFYLLKAMTGGSAADREYIDRRLFATWEKMILRGATSLWETEAGGDDFDFAGSLCHGWSALPAYYCSSFLLGIEPLTPGFEQFRIRVMPGRHQSCQGSIRTPYGNIEVAWVKCRTGLEIRTKGPEECRPKLEVLSESPVLRATYNGKSVVESGV